MQYFVCFFSLYVHLYDVYILLCFVSVISHLAMAQGVNTPHPTLPQKSDKGINLIDRNENNNVPHKLMMTTFN